MHYLRPPKFDMSDFQLLSMSELRCIGIGTRPSPGKLDLIVFCPLKGGALIALPRSSLPTELRRISCAMLSHGENPSLAWK